MGQPRRRRQSIRAYIFTTESVVVRGRYEILNVLPYGFNWKLKKPINTAKKTNKINLVDEEFQAVSKLLISSSTNTEQSISLTNEIPEFQEGEKRFGEGFPIAVEIDRVYPREEILVNSNTKPTKIKNKSKKTKSSPTVNGSISISNKTQSAPLIHDLTHKRKELYTSGEVSSNDKLATNSYGSNTTESQVTINSNVKHMTDKDDTVTKSTTVYIQDVINPHKFPKLNEINENEVVVGDDHNVIYDMDTTKNQILEQQQYIELERTTK
jgi:hypothetical protein